MKRLAFLFILLTSPAFAQVGPEVYKPVSNAQIQPFDDTEAYTITQNFFYRMVRIVCDASCYVAIYATGQTTGTVTNVTGIYLPPNLPTLFSVSRLSTISVIGAESSGSMHVIELSK